VTLEDPVARVRRALEFAQSVGGIYHEGVVEVFDRYVMPSFDSVWTEETADDPMLTQIPRTWFAARLGVGGKIYSARAAAPVYYRPLSDSQREYYEMTVSRQALYSFARDLGAPVPDQTR
jgi:hypothetical protein